MKKRFYMKKTLLYEKQNIKKINYKATSGVLGYNVQSLIRFIIFINGSETLYNIWTTFLVL